MTSASIGTHLYFVILSLDNILVGVASNESVGVSNPKCILAAGTNPILANVARPLFSTFLGGTVSTKTVEN